MSTPQIDFYVLPERDPAQRALFACRLAEKAFRLGHRVHLHTAGAAEAQTLDELLWNFHPASFVPHALSGAEGDVPVRIGWGGAQAGGDLLINLDLAVPPFFDRFPRVAEIVVQSDAVQRALRDHFRLYRERGLEPQTRDLRKPSP
jgi:DNA polymerase-3 subunit chi